MIERFLRLDLRMLYTIFKSHGNCSIQSPFPRPIVDACKYSSNNAEFICFPTERDDSQLIPKLLHLYETKFEFEKKTKSSVYTVYFCHKFYMENGYRYYPQTGIQIF